MTETKLTEKSGEAGSGSARKTTKKIARQVPVAHAYIQASYNNTMVTITDPAGNALGWSSAGVVGFKGPKKATPYAASVMVKDIVEKITPYGVKELQVFICGIGGGREGTIRALNANGFFVKSIKDVTPLPHNGCRPPKPRRV